jgi:hypothetical protein
MNDELKMRALQALATLKELTDEVPDSLEFGTPATGGAMKIYHRADDLEGFKRKIDVMLEARAYAQEKTGWVPKEKK